MEISAVSDANIAAPFHQYATVVPPEWIDVNKHMNARFYSIVIYEAHALFSEYIGIGENYVNTRKLGKNVVEAHIIYERELLQGDRIEVHSRLLGVGDKRLHFYHEVFNIDRGYRAAIGEQLDIHVDLTTRRACNFPPEVREQLAVIARAHARLPAPDKIGRRVSMERPPK